MVQLNVEILCLFFAIKMDFVVCSVCMHTCMCVYVCRVKHYLFNANVRALHCVSLALIPKGLCRHEPISTKLLCAQRKLEPRICVSQTIGIVAEKAKANGKPMKKNKSQIETALHTRRSVKVLSDLFHSKYSLCYH